MLTMPYRLLGPKLLPDKEYWFRADDKRYANYDPWAEFEQPSGSHLTIEITPYLVTRHTPKGVFVRHWFDNHEIYVLGNSVRQLCVPTIEFALYDLIKRKEKHVQMSQFRMSRAEEHLNAAIKLYKTEKEKIYGPV